MIESTIIFVHPGFWVTHIPSAESADLRRPGWSIGAPEPEPVVNTLRWPRQAAGNTLGVILYQHTLLGMTKGLIIIDT